MSVADPAGRGDLREDGDAAAASRPGIVTTVGGTATARPAALAAQAPAIALQPAGIPDAGACSTPRAR
jgi:hypothetical protein